MTMASDRRDMARRRRGWAAVLAGSTALAVAACPDIAAAVTVTYVQIDANGLPLQRGKDAGDLDGDGIADIVVASASGGVDWYKNPTRARTTVDPGVKTTRPITVGDIDGVNGSDIIVPVPGGAVWFANNGHGTAWTRRTLLTGQNVHDAEIVDVDGDGKRDVVVRNEYPSGDLVVILRQITLNTWDRTDIAVDPGTGLAMADLDGDGRSDIVIGKYWFKNNSSRGSVSFLGPRTYNLAAEQDAMIAIGDLNGDDRPDLFITSPHPTFPGGGKTAWYAQPRNLANTWPQHVLETYDRREYHSAVVGDLDGDGDNDLATATTVAPSASAKVEAFFNNGSGSFTPFTVAKVNSHEVHMLIWRGKPSLFGSSKSRKPVTSVDLWQISP